MTRLFPSTALFMAVLTLLTSCNPKVQFNEPMPPGRYNLPNIPKAFRGEIVDGDEVWTIGKDTVRMDDEVMVNGEDFLLRRMAGHVVMSQPVAETGQWEVFLLKREGDVFRTASFEDDESWLRQTATFMESPRERKKSGGKPGYSYWLLSPTAKEFRTVLKQGLYELAEGSVPLPRGGQVRPSAPPPPTN